MVKPTQSAPHATGVYLTQMALLPIMGENGLVRCKLPLNLGVSDRPEPDLAVVEGSVRDYAVQHPTAAVLVVEISDTSLAYDRTTKMGVYAQAGISEYWIVNLTDRLLEVYRQPAPMTDEPSGHGYRSITRYTEDQTVAPLAAPNAPVKVSDLLP